MKHISIALVGCGAASRRYYLPAFKRYRHLIGHLWLVDKNRASAERLAHDIGFGRVEDDHRAVIGKVDGAIIVVPHFLHYRVTMDFLDAGSHVLCEKPLAESAREVREMNEAAKGKGVFLCVNNTRRVFPSFKRVREIIDSGEVGSLQSISFCEGNVFEWASATGFYVDPKVSSKGVLLDVGAHVLDLICWWVGARPAVIAYEDDSHGGPESVARLEAKAGECRIDVLLNRLCALDNKFKVTGEKESIEGSLFEWGELTVHKKSGESMRRKLACTVKTYPEFVLPVVENFLRVVRGEQEPLVSGSDVAHSIELIEECYQRRTKGATFSKNLSVPQLRRQGTVLVTGATGFIGGRVAEVLHFAGCKVRAPVRQWASAARLGRMPVEIVPMDLMKPDEIVRALDGVTEIIHTAKGSTDVTVQGTSNLLHAALRKGIRRFVHVSTADVYGNVIGTITEESPFVYTGTEYNRSKIDAEKVCWECYGKGLLVTVMRPSIVYGPFSKNWSLRYATMFIAGKGGIYEQYGEGMCNAVYVDDLVRAILLALEHEGAVGQAFNVNGPEVVTWNDYFRRYNDVMGLPPLRVLKVSHTGAKTAVLQPVRIVGGLVRDHFMGPVKKVADTFAFAKRLMKQAEGALKTTPSPEELELYGRKVVFSSEKAQRLIGFVPLVSLDEGMRRTVEWLGQQGFLSFNGKGGSLRR